MKTVERPANGQKTGDPIEGSQYFRAYCSRCGTPMRVVWAIAESIKQGGTFHCGECNPRPLAEGRPATREESSPWQDNAIRAMEDR